MRRPGKYPSDKNLISIIIILIVVIMLFTVLENQSDIEEQPVIPTSSSQQDAVQRLANESGEEVKAYIDNGVIRNLRFKWHGKDRQSPADLIMEFIDRYPDIFNITSPKSQLELVNIINRDNGYQTVVYSQKNEGIPVYSANLNFQINSDGEIIYYTGGYIPNLIINTTPKIDYQQAYQILSDDLNMDDPLVEVKKGELIIINFPSSDLPEEINPILAWKISVLSGEVYSSFFIDANSGNILGEIPFLIFAKDFKIYDAKNKDIKNILGLDIEPELVLDEKGPIDNKEIDQDALNILSHHNTVYDFFFDNFKWESYDGNDSRLTSVVNVKIDCPNAQWDSNTKEMYFCDDLTQSVDILAHEFTHGVSRETLKITPNLFYKIKTKLHIYSINETNAVSESLSDIFAAFIDHQHPWQICYSNCEGDDLIRDLANPSNNTRGALPAHYADLVYPNSNLCDSKDEINYGCGHYNSTIFSHAVYLFTNQIGFEKSQHIIFFALANKMIPQDTDFINARIGIVKSCRENIGSNFINKKQINGVITEDDCQEIENAYDQVGILDPITPTRPYPISQPTPGIASGVKIPKIASKNSQTIILIDTSGSMMYMDVSGVEKITAAQHAASNLLDVIASEQQASGDQTNHQVGLVAFSDTANVFSPLSGDINSVKDAALQLSPLGSTAMAAGLQEAISLFGLGSQQQRMIVLLSDGMPNIGINASNSFFGLFTDEQAIQDEILDLAAEAGKQNICVHTIGFGNPENLYSYEYIDEQFLRQVASASGCGQYYGAQQATQLANVFVELRHASLGSLILQKSGTIQQGETLSLGSVTVPPNREQLMLTLNWPGSRLRPVLVDPQGRQVDASYPGTTVTEGDTITTILVDRPRGGNWQLSIFGQDVPQGSTDYNALLSTRGSLAPQQAETPTWLWLGLVALVVGLGVAITKSQPKSDVGPQIRAEHAQKQPPADSACLIGTIGALAGKRVRILKGGLLGRGPQCQLVIPDPAVSRVHARLFYAQGRWYIQDQGSRSGTFINDRRISRAPLQHNDTVRLGRSSFVFREQ